MQFLDSLQELVEALLALRTADNLADGGEKHVHGAYGLAIGVLLHVEGLDFLGVAGEDYRTLEMLLHEVALVLALKVDAPAYGEFELPAAGQKYVDGFGVAQTHELLAYHGLESRDQLFVVVLVKELEVVAAVVEGVVDAVFQEILGEVHVFVDVDECDLRLDHPELGQMARSIGVFGAERRAEGVDCTEGGGAQLAFELTGYGERCRLAEEVGGVVYGTLFGARQVVKVEGGDLKHSAGSLAVACGDQRGVQVEETALLEVAVDGVGQSGAHAEHGRERVGARAQVGDFAQELKRVAFLLQRVCLGVGTAVEFELLHLDFNALALALALHKDTRGCEGRTGGERLQLLVGEGVHVEHQLDVADRGAVVEGYELHIFVAAMGTDPSLDADLLAQKRRSVGEKVGYLDTFHIFLTE